MVIGNVTSTQLANAVWSFQGRTLNTDLLGTLKTEDTAGNVTTTTGAGAGTPGAWVQIVASTAHSVRGLIVSQQSASVMQVRFELGTGGAGSEAVACGFLWFANGTDPQLQYIPLDVGDVIKSVRVAIRATNLTNANANTVNNLVTLLE